MTSRAFLINRRQSYGRDGCRRPVDHSRSAFGIIAVQTYPITTQGYSAYGTHFTWLDRALVYGLIALIAGLMGYINKGKQTVSYRGRALGGFCFSCAISASSMTKIGPHREPSSSTFGWLAALLQSHQQRATGASGFRNRARQVSVVMGSPAVIEMILAVWALLQ